MSTLQERIRIALKRADMKPTSLARQCGISRATVSLWVNGPTQHLEGDNLTRAARALNIDAHWLATGEGSPQPAGQLAEEPGYYGTAEENQLLKKFKSLDHDDKQRALALLDVLLKFRRTKGVSR